MVQAYRLDRLLERSESYASSTLATHAQPKRVQNQVSYRVNRTFNRKVYKRASNASVGDLTIALQRKVQSSQYTAARTTIEPRELGEVYSLYS
jgi:hypothetical protein